MPEMETFESVASETMARCGELREAILREQEDAKEDPSASMKRSNEMGKLTAEVITLARKAASLVRAGDTAAERRFQEVRSAITETLKAVQASMESLGEAKKSVIREATMQDRRACAIRAYTANAK